MERRSTKPCTQNTSEPTSAERRRFLRLGLTITGVLAGNSMWSVTALAATRTTLQRIGVTTNYPYKPHYAMIVRYDRCIDCEKCMEACARTNHVPAYGYRTTILSREKEDGGDLKRMDFLPVLCNQCNRPPCVRVCPSRATYKDKKNGIVMTDPQRCIGCRTCMTVCPYNARYFNEELRSVDKCDFCFRSRLSNGKSVPACVEACPANVLFFGDLADHESEVYKLIHAPDVTVFALRPDTGTLPNVFYLKN